jgi:uncharacterized protein (TIGR00251 family)
VIALTPHPRGTVIAVKAQPGAKRNAILGVRGDALRVAVTVAPERGKANDAVADVLAEALGVKGSQISLLTGETSREKRFLIEGATPADLEARLTPLLESS